MSQHTHHQRQSKARAIAIAQEQQDRQGTLRLAVIAGLLAAAFSVTSALQHAPSAALPQAAPLSAPAPAR